MSIHDPECVELLQWALPRLGLRWRGIRRVRGQVCKRIGRRMAALGIDGVQAYRQRLEADPAEWRVFDSLCRVTISRFFRDRGVFEWLVSAGLPALAAAALARGDARVRVWSAGCASGEEPYSIAIAWRCALAPRFPRLACDVVATDVDEGLLERARRACYAEGTLRELPLAWREQAFERRDGGLCLRAAFREPVTFRREDLREGQPDGPFDLILCRNLAFTYFGRAWQERTLAAILERLVPRGVLVLGAHETPEADLSPLEKVSAGLPIYRKPERPRESPQIPANHS